MQNVKSKGFLTLELLLTITIFSMILMAFQDALRLSLRSQRKLELITEKIQEKSMFIEALQRDLMYLVPLKDGKQIYFINDSDSFTLRFISQRPITYPPRKVKSRILLIEYSFNKLKKNEPVLNRRVQEIFGYNEFTLEKEIKDAYLSSYMQGGILLDYKFEGKINLSWFEESKYIDLRWKKSIKSDEIDFYRFYFLPFKISEKNEKKSI
ncbi:MAG: hypothetical protein COB02_03635 [Candidatus Cloacimonadota bacterium]|nr:MAG: hypothetical protein COB02_03635 [Candidatus Cloacimonadota bacterium]